MEQKRIAGEKATDYIQDGMTLGLGTGSTAYYMIQKVVALCAKRKDLKLPL